MIGQTVARERRNGILLEEILTEEPTDTKKRALLCVNTLLEKKAGNLVVLQVCEVSSIADYFIICSATSSRQVQALSSWLQEQLKKHDVRPLGVEGEQYGKWVLLDYDDVIVHIFYEPLRELYEIERLWADAPKMEIDEKAAHLTDLTCE